MLRKLAHMTEYAILAVLLLRATGSYAWAFALAVGLAQGAYEAALAYARERQVIRKLFGFAALDDEVSVEVERSERQRRHSLAHLAARLVAGGHIGSEVAAATELLAALTSFQAFEAFAFDAGPRLTERRLLDLVRAGLAVFKEKGRNLPITFSQAKPLEFRKSCSPTSVKI